MAIEPLSNSSRAGLDSIPESYPLLIRRRARKPIAPWTIELLSQIHCPIKRPTFDHREAPTIIIINELTFSPPTAKHPPRLGLCNSPSYPTDR